MRKLAYTLLALVTLVVAACSNVDESDRYIYIKPTQAKRCVLIEDFTGQNCVFCPYATDVIETLQKQYGADTVIAVGIHSGKFGVYPSDGVVGLRTATGDEYYNYWKIQSQPNGVVDRSYGVMDYTMWTAIVNYDLQQTPPVSLSVNNTYNKADGSVDINVQAIGTTGTTTGKLQVWVVEDSIKAYQIMPPQGTRNDNYIHNHVFRAAVNGTWGDDVNVAEGEVVDRTYHYQLDSKWQPRHLYIVAFVYNSNGVCQATRKAVIE